MAQDYGEITRLRVGITRLSRRMRQHSGASLTPTQLSGLMTIARGGPLRPSELARRERVGRSTVTRLVARLEAQGCVERVEDPDDGRSSRIALSDHGRQLVDRSLQQVDAYLAQRLASLPADDRDQLLAVTPILERLVAERS